MTMWTLITGLLAILGQITLVCFLMPGFWRFLHDNPAWARWRWFFFASPVFFLAVALYRIEPSLASTSLERGSTVVNAISWSTATLGMFASYVLFRRRKYA